MRAEKTTRRADPEPETSSHPDRSGIRRIPRPPRPETIIDGWLDELDPARPSKVRAVPPPIPRKRPPPLPVDDSPVDFDAVMSRCRPRSIPTPSSGEDIPAVPGIGPAFLLRPDAPTSLVARRSAPEPPKRPKLRTVLISLLTK